MPPWIRVRGRGARGILGRGITAAATALVGRGRSTTSLGAAHLARREEHHTAKSHTPAVLRARERSRNGRAMERELERSTRDPCQREREREVAAHGGRIREEMNRTLGH